MRPPVRISTEFAFLLSGVFIMLVAWALNLIGVLAGQTSSGHGVSDVYLWLILMFQGLAFSTMGVVGSNYRELMANPVLRKRYLVGFLLIADGGLHLLALNQHLDNVAAAAFFAIVSPVQIVGGIVFQFLPRGLDRAWLLFTAFLIAAFVVTRTVPIWPIGYVEDVDPLGLFSKLVELGTVVILVSLVRADRLAKTTRSSSLPRPRGTQRGTSDELAHESSGILHLEELARRVAQERRDHALLPVAGHGTNIVEVPELAEIDLDLPDFAGSEEIRFVQTAEKCPSRGNNLESVEIYAGVLQRNRDGPVDRADGGTALGELIEAPLVLAELDVRPGEDRSASELKGGREYEVRPDEADPREPHETGYDSCGHIDPERFLRQPQFLPREANRGAASPRSKARQ